MGGDSPDPVEPTAQERELTQQQIRLAEQQLIQIERQSELQQQFAGDIQPLLETQALAAERALAEEERLGPIREELLNLSLEDVRRGGAATPEAQALIGEVSEAALEKGLVDIERFESEGLESLREELAGSLGLRPGDTPILDRGSRLSAEALRQRGQLSSGLREAAASAELNLPLAQSQLLQASALGQQRLQESVRQFQSQLQNQAFTNRLNLQSNVGGLGIGLAQAARPQIPNFNRGFAPTTPGLGLAEFGDVASGIGGLLTGISKF